MGGGDAGRDCLVLPFCEGTIPAELLLRNRGLLRASGGQDMHAHLHTRPAVAFLAHRRHIVRRDLERQHWVSYTLLHIWGTRPSPRWGFSFHGILYLIIAMAGGAWEETIVRVVMVPPRFNFLLSSLRTPSHLPATLDQAPTPNSTRERK